MAFSQWLNLDFTHTGKPRSTSVCCGARGLRILDMSTNAWTKMPIPNLPYYKMNIHQQQIPSGRLRQEDYHESEASQGGNPVRLCLRKSKQEKKKQSKHLAPASSLVYANYTVSPCRMREFEIGLTACGHWSPRAGAFYSLEPRQVIGSLHGAAGVPSTPNSQLTSQRKFSPATVCCDLKLSEKEPPLKWQPWPWLFVIPGDRVGWVSGLRLSLQAPRTSRQLQFPWNCPHSWLLLVNYRNLGSRLCYPPTCHIRCH